jgi:hypothetical protein
LTAAGPQRDLLLHQLSITWSLAEATLADLTLEECLWVPSPDSWTVREDDAGRWVADWADPAPWPAPPTSLAWLQWHVLWWWSTALGDWLTGEAVRREDVIWPGPDEAMAEMRRLHDRHVDWLQTLTDTDLGGGSGANRVRWPYPDARPLWQLLAWVNVELTKNVAEMSLTRRSTPYFAGGAIGQVARPMGHDTPVPPMPQ